MPTVRFSQFKDLDGNIDFMNNAGKVVTNGTTVIFTGLGILIGMQIHDPIDGGSFHWTNSVGDPIDGLVNTTLKGVTTRAGTFGAKNTPCPAGLKIVVANAVDVVIAIAAAKPA
ncbi:hypothetical protein LCGC14_1237830 [marine sediment metagenome]|uniref:DUF2190 domain-containing protein n=1 Tax=marine sediment metagenome TaxID=412755 RepID=A0A0F9LAT0_9ZZZZ